VALVLTAVVTLASVTSGTAWAMLTDQAAGGPEALVSAALSSTPSTPMISNGGCSGTNQQTNTTLAWTDAQSGVADASGGSLVSGYTVGRATTSGGTYTAAGTTSGNPAPTAYTDKPTVANTPVALIANTAKQAYPLTESTLSAGAALTIGTASNEVNAIQVTPDGLTTVVAEYTAGEVQVLTWSGTAWSVAKSITVADPTAVAIDPIPNGSGYYVAYVVSDPGTTTNGSVIPVTLDGASSSAGTAITVAHQANPTAIVVTPNGAEAYVANYNSNTVSAIATATGIASTIALPGTAPHPIALAATFDSSHVYVADRANGYVDDITVSTNTVTAHVVLATGSLNDTHQTASGDPNLLAMLPSGKSLYVAEYGTSEVQVVATALSSTPDVVSATISTGSGSGPIDMAMSPNGCLVYVADWPSNDIFTITTATNTEALAFTTTCETQDPQPMQVTPDNLYLVIPENYSCGDVQIMNTSTNAVTTVTGVGTAPTMVAIPPVPVWYQITATHVLWNSLTSTPAAFSAGWNPGGWQ
jgi:DNA-binding beta-propeller fold protein YncE